MTGVSGVFHRPVGDNIQYGRLDAGESELVAAAQRAHSHDFIIRRPSGYGSIRIIPAERGSICKSGSRCKPGWAAGRVMPPRP